MPQVTHLPPAPANDAGVRGRCQGIALPTVQKGAICDREGYNYCIDKI